MQTTKKALGQRWEGQPLYAPSGDDLGAEIFAEIFGDDDDQLDDEQKDD